jgi:hypothetical protein
MERGVEVVLTCRQQLPEAARRGVAHQNVEAADLALDELHHALDVVLLADVRLHQPATTPQSGDFRRHFHGSFLGADVIDNDVGPRLRTCH